LGLICRTHSFKSIDNAELLAENRGQLLHQGFLYGCFTGSRCSSRRSGDEMHTLLRNLWLDQDGQDIAEYAVMLAVILVIVVGTIRLIGTQSNIVFSNVASSIQ
jgi:Flp pilus assembly pilin Flp